MSELQKQLELAKGQFKKPFIYTDCMIGLQYLDAALVEAVKVEEENEKLRKCLDAEWDEVAVEKILTDVEQVRSKLESMKIEVYESGQKTKDCYKVLKTHRESIGELQAKVKAQIRTITDLDISFHNLQPEAWKTYHRQKQEIKQLQAELEKAYKTGMDTQRRYDQLRCRFDADQDEIEQLQADLEQARGVSFRWQQIAQDRKEQIEKSPWHLVSEGELPKNIATVWVLLKAEATNTLCPNMGFYGEDENGRGWEILGPGLLDEVTHWMPIPELPEAKDE